MAIAIRPDAKVFASLPKSGVFSSIDLIICLSHLGYEYATEKISDRKLAQKTDGIDLIIGGHTHTFLEKPTVEYNLGGKITLVNQVGWAGVQLGRVDFYVGDKVKSDSGLILID